MKHASLKYSGVKFLTLASYLSDEDIGFSL